MLTGSFTHQVIGEFLQGILIKKHYINLIDMQSCCKGEFR